MTIKDTRVRKAKTDIFADLELPNAKNHFLKAQIVAELYRLTNARRLTQQSAGDLMGISQPEVSRLFKGHFREYSIERLLVFLTAFDQDVEIVTRPHRPHRRSTQKTCGRITFKSEEPAGIKRGARAAALA